MRGEGDGVSKCQAVCCCVLEHIRGLREQRLSPSTHGGYGQVRFCGIWLPMLLLKGSTMGIRAGGCGHGATISGLLESLVLALGAGIG